MITRLMLAIVFILLASCSVQPGASDAEKSKTLCDKLTEAVNANSELKKNGNIIIYWGNQQNGTELTVYGVTAENKMDLVISELKKITADEKGVITVVLFYEKEVFVKKDGGTMVRDKANERLLKRFQLTP